MAGRRSERRCLRSSHERAAKRAKRERGEDEKMGNTHPDLLIFCACSEVFPVWTETHAANIQVCIVLRLVVSQHTKKVIN